MDQHIAILHLRLFQLPNPDEKGENGGLDDRSISKHSNSVLAEEEDLLDINRNIFNLVFKKNIRIFIFF